MKIQPFNPIKPFVSYLRNIVVSKNLPKTPDVSNVIQDKYKQNDMARFNKHVNSKKNTNFYSVSGFTGLNYLWVLHGFEHKFFIILIPIFIIFFSVWIIFSLFVSSEM